MDSPAPWRAVPFSRPLAAVLVAPHLLVAAWLAAAAALGAIGMDPFWREQRFNISQAIIVRDYGQALRAMGEGADPNARYPAPHEFAGQPDAITPLEAAAYLGDIDLVKAVLQYAAPDDTERRRVACVGVQRGAEEIAELLLGRVVTNEECAAVMAAQH